jgi:AcrR family transcriptional regulator
MKQCPLQDKRREMLHTPNLNNRQVQRTRKWIFDALMILIAERPYNKITVSDIIKRAGIARQTFYRNYENKNEVIFQYFRGSFTSDLLSVSGTGSENTVQDIVISFDPKYVLEYREELRTVMKIPEIESLVFAKFKEWQNLLLDRYKDIFSREDYVLFRYKAGYQLVGYLQVFSDWFNTDMPVSVEKLNSILDTLSASSRLIGGGTPNIIINIKAFRSS